MFRVLAPVAACVLATMGATGHAAPGGPGTPPRDTASPATPGTTTTATSDTAAPPAPPAPPAPGEPGDPGAAAFERQLGEISFGTFLVIELGVDPDVFTCAEPASPDPDEVLTCFAIVDARRVVIARSPASAGTGRFSFDVLADYEITGQPDDSAPAEQSVPDSTVAAGTDSVPVTYSDAERNDANVAVLVYGDGLDGSASSEIGAIVEASNGSVLAVSAWRWDAATATFTIDYTLDARGGLSTEQSAWLTTGAMSAHWEAGQPFRHPAATIRPALSVAVGGLRFVSDWSLMVRVADGAIADEEWRTAARAS